MKYALTHLSGPLSGTTQYFGQARLTIGSLPDNDLHISPNGKGSHVPSRVEIIQNDCEVRLRNTDPNVTILVNQNPLQEALLQNNDLLQLGSDGPKIRFRIRPEEYALCKRGPEIWRDTIEMVAEEHKDGHGAVRPFVRHLSYEVRHYGSTMTQLVVLALILGLFGSVFWGGYYLYFTLQREHQRDLAVLLEQLKSAQVKQAHLEKRIAEERQRLGASLAARNSEMDRLTTQLEEQTRRGQGASSEVRVLRRRLEALEAEQTKKDIFIREYGPSVCFLYIAYGFFLEGKPTTVASIPLEYMGSGFLINDRGQVVTNRHIVEPWTMDAATHEILSRGIEPKLVELLAYFPGKADPFQVAEVHSSSAGDVAIVQLTPIPRTVPAIPIHTPTHPATAGMPVVILGYPVGVEALLARMNSDVVNRLLSQSGHSLKRLVQEVADRNGIRPLANQGHIGDVVPGRIVYDAPTTGGASGSPVFNTHGEVIAVNAAIMTRFGGANSGIPIKLVLDLLSSRVHPR